MQQRQLSRPQRCHADSIEIGQFTDGDRKSGDRHALRGIDPSVAVSQHDQFIRFGINRQQPIHRRQSDDVIQAFSNNDFAEDTGLFRVDHGNRSGVPIGHKQPALLHGESDRATQRFAQCRIQFGGFAVD